MNRAYKYGKTVRSQLLTLKFAPNPKRTGYRAAVVISRKINKSSVTRNRIRRKIYETIRQYDKQIEGGFDLIFNVYSDEIANMDINQVSDLIGVLLKQAKII